MNRTPSRSPRSAPVVVRHENDTHARLLRPGDDLLRRAPAVVRQVRVAVDYRPHVLKRPCLGRGPWEHAELRDRLVDPLQPRQSQAVGAIGMTGDLEARKNHKDTKDTKRPE
jgi:hypothetical protein